MHEQLMDLRKTLSALQSELGDSTEVAEHVHIGGVEVPKTTLFDSPESETEPNVIVGNDPGDENDSVEPDGFHGKSYSDFEKDQYCQCEEVKNYGMVCVTCSKPYQIKTTFTMGGSAGVSASDE